MTVPHSLGMRDGSEEAVATAAWQDFRAARSSVLVLLDGGP